jgi:hypothetical protein
MLKRSLAVVLLFLGGSHAASALEQRCGGPFDWLLCVDPSLSYSEPSPPSPQVAAPQSDSDTAAAQKSNAPVGLPAPGPQRQRQPGAPLSLDYRVTNHGSKTGADRETVSPASKAPQGHGRTMSKEKKEELYRAFLVWQRRQVINEMRDQPAIR